MTREEAISKWIIPAIKNTWNENKCKEILEALEQEPKSEWEHDHEILKAYSDGANEVVDKIRAEIEETYINLTYEENHNVGGSWGLRKALEIIDKYKAEIETQESEDNE